MKVSISSLILKRNIWSFLPYSLIIYHIDGYGFNFLTFTLCYSFEILLFMLDQIYHSHFWSDKVLKGPFNFFYVYKINFFSDFFVFLAAEWGQKSNQCTVRSSHAFTSKWGFQAHPEQVGLLAAHHLSYLKFILEPILLSRVVFEPRQYCVFLI